MDMNYSLYHPEWSYELISTLSLKNSAWSMASHYCRDIYYCDQCNNSESLFGCIAVNHGNHCIFNLSYSTQEYETLCARIIDHMKSTGEWGEFFPHTLSPFGYDETVAQEYFMLTKEETIQHDWKWKGKEETSSYHGSYYTPLSIEQYNERKVGYDVAQKNIDDLLAGILQCVVSKRPFKIIKQELVFYIEN